MSDMLITFIASCIFFMQLHYNYHLSWFHCVTRSDSDLLWFVLELFEVSHFLFVQLQILVLRLLHLTDSFQSLDVSCRGKDGIKLLFQSFSFTQWPVVEQERLNLKVFIGMESKTLVDFFPTSSEVRSWKGGEEGGENT